MTSESVQAILVAYDFDEVSDHALAFARQLAKPLQATITLVHVAEVKVHGPRQAPFPPPDVFEQLAAESSKELKKVTESFQDVPATFVVLRGVPGEEIPREADPNRYQLLVMASHSRRGVARALLGSVAEKVVRSARIPVLVVPSGA